MLHIASRDTPPPQQAVRETWGFNATLLEARLTKSGRQGT